MKAYGAGERRRQLAPLPVQLARRNSSQPSPAKDGRSISRRLHLPLCANTDFMYLAGHSRRRRQRSTPRSTARRAQGTLLPSTRSTLSPAQFLAPAFRLHFMPLKVRARQSGGRVGGRSCFGQGASGSFHFTFFFLSSGEAQKEKKKSTQKGENTKKQISRSMTTRERSSVQSFRSSI